MVLDGSVLEDGINWAYHALGHLYANQGKLAEAEQTYKWAPRGYEKTRYRAHVDAPDG
jgi:hypothetical protein